ncbi:MAG: TIGR03790 family protein [Phycisphaerales bacterium]
MKNGLRFSKTICTVFLAMTIAFAALAGGGPENVAVVVNSDSWASKAVANTYIHLRNIPPGNVVYLDDVPTFETISVDDFREKILGPTLQQLDVRKLAAQIDCIVYSTDLPYAVDVKSDVEGITLPQVIRPTGSINGLTYLFGPVMAKQPVYLDLQSNAYYRRTGHDRVLPQLAPDIEQAYREAVAAMQEQRYDEAERTLAGIVEAHPDFAEAWYNFACCQSLLGRADVAMEALSKAVEHGWDNAEHTLNDADLATLRTRDDFRALTRTMRRDEILTTTPTRGFRAQQGWLRDGEPAPPGQPAMHYMLSTMLAYTAGRGTSVNEAIESLERAAAADGTSPRGTVFFIKNTDVRSTTRQWGFASAVEHLRGMGVEAKVYETHSVPRERVDIIGLMAGSANLKLDQAEFRFLPGAIAEHLTSTGGTMHERGSQTPISELIARGAAGSSGTVIEPYAIQQKFPSPFMHVHYARGCSLAEAFYQSVQGPYQLLIIGDPLCAPWAKRPIVQVRDLRAGQTMSGVVTCTPTVGAGGPAVKGFEIFVDGRRVGASPPGANMRFDSSDLSDGWHELRLVAVVDDLIETQGHFILPIIIDNHNRATTLRASSTRVALSDSITFDAESAGAEKIDIVHNSRVVATVDGAGGKVDVPAATFGPGNVVVFAHASHAADADADAAGDAVDDVSISSPPIALSIDVGAALPPVDPPRNAQPGFVVTSGGETYQVRGDTIRGRWLRDLGVADGQDFTIEGWFLAEQDDLFQLQFRMPRQVTIEIDGNKTDLGRRAGWRYVPLPLGRGMHRLRIIVTGPGPAVLDARLGSRGTKRLNGEAFTHAGR